MLILDPPGKLLGISPPLLPVRSVFFSGPVWVAAATGTQISSLWLEERALLRRGGWIGPGRTARPVMATHRSLDVNKRLQTLKRRRISLLYC